MFPKIREDGREFLEELEQGSEEWLALRKTKITATDAVVIMGASPWKTPRQLYFEKESDFVASPPNARMQRGLDLEPVARDRFCQEMSISVRPIVVVFDWAMSSLDGMSEDMQTIVEIKCPGEKDHALACRNQIPEHYFAQLQFQMYVCNVQFEYYYSYSGLSSALVKLERDDEYITKMLVECDKFRECRRLKIPPEMTLGDYIERYDDEWEVLVSNWKSVQEDLKKYEKEEAELRSRLINLCEGKNTRGFGITLCQIQRKGLVDYSKIPELIGIDLEAYRKPSSSSWRISCL